jgi:hypothetical protein
MKIFFDVDHTILGLDDSLRPGTKETLQKLNDDKHRVYIWSGMGERWEVIETHRLTPWVSGVYEKPTHHFPERLGELRVPFEPEVVAAFGGVWVPPYFFNRKSDWEMDRVYNIVCDFATTGTSDDRQYWEKGSKVLPF